jgi:acyl-coenzyme A thioesterase PaaI-like protein
MTGDPTKPDKDRTTQSRVGDWPEQTPDQQIVRGMVSYTPYAKALGMKYVSSSPGHGEILLPWREDLVGQGGSDILAPGVLTALIDHVCGLAIMATFDLRIDHMRPAAPRGSITAAANCYKSTRNIAFLRAEAWDVSRDDLVATAQAAFILNRKEQA